MSHSSPTSNLAARLAPWLVSILSIFAVVAFVFLYAPAKDLAWEASKIIFSLLFTPFILEIACIIAGFLIVIYLNNRRLAKESADEWVYLHQVDPGSGSHGTGADSEIPEPLRHRIEDAPFVDKPTPGSPADRLAEIEGYLDLKMTAEATRALFEIPQEIIKELPFLIQRVRLAALRGDQKGIETLIIQARDAGATRDEIEAASRG